MNKFFLAILISLIAVFSGCSSEKDKSSEREPTSQEVKSIQDKIASEPAIDKFDKENILNNSAEIYDWCYWMLEEVGFSNDLLQHHTGIGTAEAMSDLKFTMGELKKDLTSERGVGILTIPEKAPANLKYLMSNAKTDLLRSIDLRQSAAKKYLGDSVSGSESVSERISQSNYLSDSVEAQLRDIQALLPEGIKYYNSIDVYESDETPPIGNSLIETLHDNDNRQTDNDTSGRKYFQTR